MGISLKMSLAFVFLSVVDDPIAQSLLATYS
jgi:hypothetical protein